MFKRAQHRRHCVHSLSTTAVNRNSDTALSLTVQHCVTPQRKQLGPTPAPGPTVSQSTSLERSRAVVSRPSKWICLVVRPFVPVILQEFLLPFLLAALIRVHRILFQPLSIGKCSLPFNLCAFALACDGSLLDTLDTRGFTQVRAVAMPPRCGVKSVGVINVRDLRFLIP